jgi:hypothetical protein
MKRFKQAIIVLAILGLLLIPHQALGDANLDEWIGTWSMNHDGHVGTLIISDSKVDCAGPAWCSMALRYIDLKVSLSEDASINSKTKTST